MTENIIEMITDLLVEHFGCNRDEITENTRFADIWIDSLDIAEMIGEIEDQIGYEVELEDHIKTVGELAKTIESCKEA